MYEKSLAQNILPVIVVTAAVVVLDVAVVVVDLVVELQALDAGR